MPRYKVYGNVTVSAWMEVEAETPEIAIRKARDADCMWTGVGVPPEDGVALVDDVDGSFHPTRAEEAS